MGTEAVLIGSEGKAQDTISTSKLPKVFKWVKSLQPGVYVT